MWSIYHNFYYYLKTHCNSPNLQQQHKQHHHLGRNKYHITKRSVSTFKGQNYSKLVCVHMCACTVDMYFSAHPWNLLLLNLANDAWLKRHGLESIKSLRKSNQSSQGIVNLSYFVVLIYRNFVAKCFYLWIKWSVHSRWFSTLPASKSFC